MKNKKMIYRRKGDRIVIEGVIRGKTAFIWTLPPPDTLITKLLKIPSFFTLEKGMKIRDILSRLDTYAEKPKKRASKVRTPNLVRTLKKDGNSEIHTENLDAELDEIISRAEEFDNIVIDEGDKNG